MTVAEWSLSGDYNPAPAESSIQEMRPPWEGKSMRHQTGVVRIIASSHGQTMVEYALILTTIAVISTALVQNAGTIVTELVGHVSALL